MYSLLKEYLLKEQVLKLPDVSKPFVLRTDASEVWMAAVLEENHRKVYPVKPGRVRYLIIEK